jgi:hypothetical protein
MRVVEAWQKLGKKRIAARSAEPSDQTGTAL